MMPSVGIREYYADKSIFITGGTGYMGKVLIEKLLRSCPDLKIIYMLVRKKKGQTPEQRLENFSNSRVFEKLLEKFPKAFSKLRLVSGDILEDNLGISIKDEEELLRECQIVFNNAACVSFNLALRDAVNQNTIGTQRVLQLAERMKKLESFVHVSTSYCHDDVEVMEEKLYPSKHDPEDIINMIKWMDDAALAAIQPELIRPYPNTYGYTKCLTESLVSKYKGKFPLAIARPSIVIPSFKEPMPGWVDNINGPTGVIYAAARGVLHTMYCKDTTKIDTIPVDLAINGLIILAYLVCIENPKEIRVCNLTQSGVNEITWIEASKYGCNYIAEYPLSYCLWYPVASGKNYKLEHKIHEFFEHTVPAYLIDLLLFLLGKKTFMVHVLRRLNNGLEVLEYYNTRTWVFKNEYFRSFPKRITEEENRIFFTDIAELDVDDYMKNYVKGLREYYCKEDISTLPQAKKLHRRLFYLHVFTKYIFFMLSIYIIYRVFRPLFLYIEN